MVEPVTVCGADLVGRRGEANLTEADALNLMRCTGLLDGQRQQRHADGDAGSDVEGRGEHRERVAWGVMGGQTR